MEEYKTYLFEYFFDGDQWGIEIKAKSPQEAQARIKALYHARYKGESIVRLSMPTFMGRLFARFKRS